MHNKIFGNIKYVPIDYCVFKNNIQNNYHDLFPTFLV